MGGNVTDKVIAVVGCGNPTRQDDGVGPAVVSELKRRGLEGSQVKLLDAGTDGMAVMFVARGCGALIVIDASCTGVEPGAIYEVPGAELERPHVQGFNLHDFRWDGALYAGRQIFGSEFPADVRVFLIEAGELGFGVGLSHAVTVAVDTVVERIAALIYEQPVSSP
jgi:hydrogenase maturation protease